MTKTINGKEVRHWFIQKPIAHNCPLRSVGAVFEEFMPTIVEQNCEWIKVYDASYAEHLESVIIDLVEALEYFKLNQALNREHNEFAHKAISKHKDLISKVRGE